MLTIMVGGIEGFDETTGQFIEILKPTELKLEHSLVSLDKWESKYHKPFIASSKSMTDEETLYYIKCMTITQNVKDETYEHLSVQNLKEIREYIDDPMTATWITDIGKKSGKKEIITSELIYYWMIALNIPFNPCQKWHVNKLLTLIRVCNAKNEETNPNKKKKSQSQMVADAVAINKARREKYNSNG